MTLAIFTDAVRFWGVFAAIITLADLARWWKRRRVGDNSYHAYDQRKWAAGMFSLSMFLLLAGVSIPLTSRLAGFTMQSPSFLRVWAAAWFFVSSAAWWFVSGRAARPRMLHLASILAFGGSLLGAALSDYG